MTTSRWTSHSWIGAVILSTITVLGTCAALVPSHDALIITAVRTGMGNTCILFSDGSITCWGNNTQGKTSPPEGTFTQISMGGVHTCALRTDESIACWDQHGWGEADPPTGSFTQVSASTYYTCALDVSGQEYCWGFIYRMPVAALSEALSDQTPQPDSEAE